MFQLERTLTKNNELQLLCMLRVCEPSVFTRFVETNELRMLDDFTNRKADDDTCEIIKLESQGNKLCRRWGGGVP